MKKVIITGKGSYIGTHIKDWLEKDGGYDVEELDVQSDDWNMYNFLDVTAVVHVAGIVHRPDISDWSLYKKVNVDLPVQIAIKAKEHGVKQFVFFSTMAVYGQNKKLARNIISHNTSTNPINMYGKSKLMAEEQLKKMEDLEFKIVIIRPPNVYGKGCKGNYISRFTGIVKKLPALPCAYTDVKQSMLYIDNLSNFIKLLIDDAASGIYMPQDEEAVSAVELMEAIGLGIKRPLKQSKCLGLVIIALRWLPIVKKAYGGIEYDTKLSNCRDKRYVVVKFKEAIKRTVGGE